MAKTEYKPGEAEYGEAEIDEECITGDKLAFVFSRPPRVVTPKGFPDESILTYEHGRFQVEDIYELEYSETKQFEKYYDAIDHIRKTLGVDIPQNYLRPAQSKRMKKAKKCEFLRGD